MLDAVPGLATSVADSIARTAGMGLMEVRSALTRLSCLGLVERSDVGLAARRGGTLVIPGNDGPAAP